MCKMIGKFGEIDGIETKDFSEMKEKLGLIGSVSDDVGGLGVYYTDEGTNYVIVDNEKPYYGEESMYKNEDFCSDINAEKAKGPNNYTVEELYQLLGSINDKYKNYQISLCNLHQMVGSNILKVDVDHLLKSVIIHAMTAVEYVEYHKNDIPNEPKRCFTIKE